LLNDYLLFSTPTQEMNMGDHFNYAYNLKNNNLISFAHVVGDSTSFNFPILASLLQPVNTVYEGKLYTSIPAFLLFSVKEKNSANMKYPAGLQTLLSQGNKNDNPILIQVQLKSNL
jgi:hypothetical protein